MTEWTDETEWFYLGDDGVENVGPFNVTEMAGFHQDGGIDAETWIWNETMEGWSESTRGARSWGDLPATAVKYIRRIEELIGVSVALVSTSPERDDTILVQDPFDG